MVFYDIHICKLQLHTLCIIPTSFKAINMGPKTVSSSIVGGISFWITDGLQCCLDGRIDSGIFYGYRNLV